MRTESSRGTRLSWLVLATLAAVVLSTADPVAAEGVYEPLPLRKREPNDLIETSAEYGRMFARRSLLYEDLQVVGMVRRIGSELTPPVTDDYIDYQFFVIRDPSPNAFAFPNGHIYVHTGMLARLRDESQLAALLAHEINHVAGHHGILGHRITAKKLSIAIFGGAIASIMTQLSNSREFEQEADDRAPLLMLDSPYDPHAAPELFELLAVDFEGLRPRVPSVWTTHPEPEARAEASHAIVSGMPSRPRDPARFDAVTYSLRATTIRDYIQDDFPYTAIALSEDMIERYPDDLEFHLLLGDAWAQLGPRAEFLPEDLSNKEKRRNLRARYRKTRAERADALLELEAGREARITNLRRALGVYEDILRRDDAYAPAYHSMGKTHEALGNTVEAGRAYVEYLRLAPDAADRPLVMGRLTEIRDLLRQEESNDGG
jgi:predicted Zn-dependent protease